MGREIPGIVPELTTQPHYFRQETRIRQPRRNCQNDSHRTRKCKKKKDACLKKETGRLCENRGLLRRNRAVYSADGR